MTKPVAPEEPDNVLQFRSTKMTDAEHRSIRAYYFGSCGPGQDFWPKRHRWGPWEYRKITATGARFRERMCKTCSLMSDREWLDDD